MFQFLKAIYAKFDALIIVIEIAKRNARFH